LSRSSFGLDDARVDEGDVSVGERRAVLRLDPVSGPRRGIERGPLVADDSMTVARPVRERVGEPAEEAGGSPT
jgi:hypothetical protein